MLCTILGLHCVCLLLDTPFWAEVGGSITFVTSGENASQFIKPSVSILGFLGISLNGGHIC